MRRALLLPFVAALLPCMTAHSQDHIAVHATATLNYLSDVPTGVTATSSGYQPQYASLIRPGFAGGVTVPVLRLPLVTVGVDVRGAASHGIADFDNALFGLRFTAKLPNARIKPWVEGAAGFLAVREANISPAASGQSTTSGQYSSHFAIYEGIAGVDYPLRKHLDLRILEIGLGSSFGTPRNTSVSEAGTGVVLHF